MKKLLLLFLGISFLTVPAQTYNKMLVRDTTTWQHFDCSIPVIPPSIQSQSQNFYFSSIAAIDTITLNTFKYKKVYNLPNSGLSYTDKQFSGYMREDTIAKKIFFKQTAASPEIMIYDFSLSVGDSSYYDFPSSPSDNGYYRLDSIKIKTEMCGPRKHFYLRKYSVNFSGNYLEHIESIGSNYHILYNYYFPQQFGCQFMSNSSQACNYPWSIGLACKRDAKSKKYQSCTIGLVNPCIQVYDSCDYGNICGGLRNYKVNKAITVYPNPTTNNITITSNLDATEKVFIRIFDLVGKEILTYKDVLFFAGENKLDVNMSTLENGVYSVVIENQRFKNSYPIIIQN